MELPLTEQFYMPVLYVAVSYDSFHTPQNALLKSYLLPVFPSYPVIDYAYYMYSLLFRYIY